MYDCDGSICFEHSGWKGRSSVLQTLSNWKDDPNETSGVQLVGQKAVDGELEEDDVDEKQEDDESTDIDEKDSEEDEEDSKEDMKSPDTEVTIEANVEPVAASEADKTSSQPEEKKTTKGGEEVSTPKETNPTEGEQDTSTVSPSQSQIMTLCKMSCISRVRKALVSQNVSALHLQRTAILKVKHPNKYVHAQKRQ